MEFKFEDLLNKLAADETFLDSPQAREAFVFSYMLTLIEI